MVKIKSHNILSNHSCDFGCGTLNNTKEKAALFLSCTTCDVDACGDCIDNYLKHSDTPKCLENHLME